MKLRLGFNIFNYLVRGNFHITIQSKLQPLLKIALPVFLFLSCSNFYVDQKQLINHHWYVKAENWQENKTGILTQDSSGGFDWEVEFYSSGKMLYASTYPVNFRDSKGVLHLKSERFIDTLYTFEFIENIIKVKKENEIYFLKIKPGKSNTFIISSGKGENFEAD